MSQKKFLYKMAWLSLGIGLLIPILDAIFYFAFDLPYNNNGWTSSYSAAGFILFVISSSMGRKKTETKEEKKK